MPDASTVDQYIQTTKILDRFLDCRRNLARVAIVGLQRQSLATIGYDFGNHSFSFFLAVHISDDNCRAIFREPSCNRCTDTATSAGDEGNLSVQSFG